MLHLTGSWQFELLEQPSSVSLGRTKVTYCFEMWPKGQFHWQQLIPSTACARHTLAVSQPSSHTQSAPGS